MGVHGHRWCVAFSFCSGRWEPWTALSGGTARSKMRLKFGKNVSVAGLRRGGRGRAEGGSEVPLRVRNGGTWGLF